MADPTPAAAPVTLIGPDGAEYDYNPATAGRPLESYLKDNKFRVATPEAPQTLGEKARAFTGQAGEALETGAAGAVEGATFGLAKPLTQMVVGKEKSARLEREHSTAHGVGEFFGAVASPVNKIAAPLEALAGAGKAAGAVRNIIAKGVGNAAVGALAGAGQAAGEDLAGENPTLNAEHLLQSGGLGALLGGGAGAGIEGVVQGAKAAAPAIAKGLAKTVQKISPGEAGVKETLEEFAANKALKAAGATKRDLDYLGEEKARGVGKMLLEHGHLGAGTDAPTAADVLESVSKHKAAVLEKDQGFFEKLEALQSKTQTADGATATFKERPDFDAAKKAVDEFESRLSPLERKQAASDVQAAREAIEEHAANGDSWGEFNKLKQNLQEKAKWSNADPSQKFGGTLRRQLSGVVRDQLDTQIVQHLGSDEGRAFVENRALLGQLIDAERIAEHGAERLGGNASIGLRDAMAGAAGFAAHGNPVTALLGTVATKVMRERGNGVIARLANSIAGSPALSGIADSFASKLGNAAPLLGEYAQTLSQAASRGSQAALATHMVLAKADPEYARRMQMAGFTPEDAATHGGVLQRAQSLAQLKAALQEHHEEVDSHVSSILAGGKSAPSVGGGTDFGNRRLRSRSATDAHDDRLDEIQQLLEHPEALADRVAARLGGLEHVAPATAAALTSTAMRATQYLAQAGAKPPKQGPLAASWTPSEAEKQTFARKYHAVVEPQSVLRHAAAGTLTPDEVAAYKAVYPEAHSDLVQRLMGKLTETKAAKVPYRQRLMVDMLTGQPTDGTATQRAIAANQQATAQQHREDAQKKSEASAKGAKAINVANRFATADQRREMKEE